MMKVDNVLEVGRNVEYAVKVVSSDHRVGYI